MRLEGGVREREELDYSEHRDGTVMVSRSLLVLSHSGSH